MNLTQASKISGVPLRTLQRWRTTKPWLFAAVCEKAADYREAIKAAEGALPRYNDKRVGKWINYGSKAEVGYE